MLCNLVSANAGKHLVLYDDGDQEWLSFQSERVTWLKNEPPPVAEPDEAPMEEDAAEDQVRTCSASTSVCRHILGLHWFDPIWSIHHSPFVKLCPCDLLVEAPAPRKSAADLPLHVHWGCMAFVRHNNPFVKCCSAMRQYRLLHRGSLQRTSHRMCRAAAGRCAAALTWRARVWSWRAAAKSRPPSLSAWPARLLQRNGRPPSALTRSARPALSAL